MFKNQDVMSARKFNIKVILLSFILLFTGYTIYYQNDNLNNLLLGEILTAVDFDGNVYSTVKIGNQVWMTENLKVTHYNDGTPMPKVQEKELWSEKKKGAYCLIENDTSDGKTKYGILYNYYVVNNGRKLAPDGWHIPSEEECMELINYLGGVQTAGIKVKDNSTSLWKSMFEKFDSESGFNGLPAGGRGKLGAACDVGYYATWWSSTSYDSLYAWHWGLYPNRDGIRANPGHKASGFSIRCIKDN